LVASSVQAAKAAVTVSRARGAIRAASAGHRRIVDTAVAELVQIGELLHQLAGVAVDDLVDDPADARRSARSLSGRLLDDHRGVTLNRVTIAAFSSKSVIGRQTSATRARQLGVPHGRQHVIDGALHTPSGSLSVSHRETWVTSRADGSIHNVQNPADQASAQRAATRDRGTEAA
jgi:hypothetical protein